MVAKTDEPARWRIASGIYAALSARMPSSVRRLEVIEHREVFQVGRLEFRVARCGQIGATSLNQPKVVGEGN